MNDKQIKFIETYLQSKNITETCKTLDISRNTAYTYLQDKDIKAEINQRRNEMLSNATIYLQDQLQACSGVLMDIINEETAPYQVKVNAINSVFNNCNKLTETTDIITRLNDIERRLVETSDIK